MAMNMHGKCYTMVLFTALWHIGRLSSQVVLPQGEGWWELFSAMVSGKWPDCRTTEAVESNVCFVNGSISFKAAVRDAN
jgi:hypothetical protein